MNICKQTSEQNFYNEEVLQLITEALLFTSSVDIIGEWSEEQRNKMIDIAVSFKQDFKKSKNIKLFKHTNYPFESSSTDKILKCFNKQIEIEESSVSFN